MTKYWKDLPWATKPELLLAEVNRVYMKAMELKKIKDPDAVALKKIMAFREWFASVPQANLLQAIKDLELIYLPKDIEPGPGFIFPIRDVTGDVRRAHIRLFDGNDYDGLRYISLVDKTKFIGPAWVGMDDDTLAAIIATGEVLVVEGPFDLLAIKTLVPEVPALCPTTKRLQKGHWDDLRIIGVEKIHVMFDNEASKRGAEAAAIMQERPHGFEVNVLQCPAHDPSDALKSLRHMESLRNTLRSLLLPHMETPALVLDDDE